MIANLIAGLTGKGLSGPAAVDYLVVAGGGGGGSRGGGGAGGFRTSTALSIGASFTVTVGGGGAIK